jgi:hypothetical protein
MLITGLFRWLKTAVCFVRTVLASRLILIRLDYYIDLFGFQFNYPGRPLR